MSFKPKTLSKKEEKNLKFLIVYLENRLANARLLGK